MNDVFDIGRILWDEAERISKDEDIEMSAAFMRLGVDVSALAPCLKRGVANEIAKRSGRTLQ